MGRRVTSSCEKASLQGLYQVQHRSTDGRQCCHAGWNPVVIGRAEHCPWGLRLLPTPTTLRRIEKSAASFSQAFLCVNLFGYSGGGLCPSSRPAHRNIREPVPYEPSVGIVVAGPTMMSRSMMDT
jgi:hypothetical protein